MKRGFCVLLGFALLLSLCACGNAAAQEVGLVNPWREITEAEALELCERSFTAPDGAENVVWSVLDAADGNGAPGALVQLSFELNGSRFTAREQISGGEEADLSGMYYNWTVQREGTLKSWSGGAFPARCFRFVGDDGCAELCTWYDAENGASYSLGVTAEDLDGFDLLAVAEAICP